MVINAKLLDAFGSRVDEPQTVLLFRLEVEFRDACVGSTSQGRVGAWVVAFPVDEIVVRQWWW